MQNRIDELQSKTESALNASTEQNSEIDKELDSLHDEFKPAAKAPTKPDNLGRSVDIVNPTSFKRRIEFITSEGTGFLKQSPPVILCDSSGSGTHWVIELPPAGSTHIDFGSLNKKDLLKSDPKVGEGLTLRNEFFELKVDENTGGIRAIQLYRTRINLASQQLAVRTPGQRDAKKQPLTKARYTTMVAQEIELVMESRLAGKIISKGQLIDSDSAIADFQQTVRVVRGLRVIEVEVEVNPLKPLSDSPNHYVCSRLAWKSEASRIIANAGETRQEISSDWFHATNFMEVIQDDHRLTMLTGGLPFHRRASRRIVDSLLMVGREQRRRFKFGLGVDVPYAMSAAVGWLTPAIELGSANETDGKNSSSWLFHFNCKNILVTWWEPLFDNQSGIDQSETGQSEWTGIQIRLRETEGRPGKLSIRCPRPVASADMVNLAGEFIRTLEVADDDPSKFFVEFGRSDFFQVTVRWKL